MSESKPVAEIAGAGLAGLAAAAALGPERMGGPRA